MSVNRTRLTNKRRTNVLAIVNGGLGTAAGPVVGAVALAAVENRVARLPSLAVPIDRVVPNTLTKDIVLWKYTAAINYETTILSRHFFFTA